MGAKKFVTIKELCALKNIKLWRAAELSRRGELPIRFIGDRPVKPYEVDLEEYEKLESVRGAIQKPRSLKTEEISKNLSHKKEKLWLK